MACFGRNRLIESLPYQDQHCLSDESLHELVYAKPSAHGIGVANQISHLKEARIICYSGSGCDC